MHKLITLIVTVLFCCSDLYAVHVSSLMGRADHAAIERSLKGGVLEGKGHLFLKAEEEYGVPAVLLAGIAIQESGGGKSKMARRQNNVFGITPNGKKGISFDSVESCVHYEAKLLRDKYINRGRTTVTSIGKKYCATGGWSKAVNNHIKKLTAKK